MDKIPAQLAGLVCKEDTMLVKLESAAEISVAQQQLEKTIRLAFKKQMKRDIGHPGGWYSGVVHTDGVRWYNVHGAATRKLNWFGKWTPKRALNISVEINPPLRGKSGRVAGFFARDERSDEIYLIH